MERNLVCKPEDTGYCTVVLRECGRLISDYHIVRSPVWEVDYYKQFCVPFQLIECTKWDAWVLARELQRTFWQAGIPAEINNAGHMRVRVEEIPTEMDPRLAPFVEIGPVSEKGQIEFIKYTTPSWQWPKEWR